MEARAREEGAWAREARAKGKGGKGRKGRKGGKEKKLGVRHEEALYFYTRDTQGFAKLRILYPNISTTSTVLLALEVPGMRAESAITDLGRGSRFAPHL